MATSLTEAPKPRSDRRGILVQLHAELVHRLDAFCEANLGAPRNRVIEEALEDYIQHRIQEEPELKRRYDFELSSAKEPFRLLKADRPKRD